MFKKILVPIDVDRPIAAKAVYDGAAAIAKPFGAEIRLISVMPGFGMPIDLQGIAQNHVTWCPGQALLH